MRHINALTSKDFKQITLDRTGRHNKPRVHETAAVKLTSYPGTVRQLVITGLGDNGVLVVAEDVLDLGDGRGEPPGLGPQTGATASAA
jgi:hypothetical protein